jgi:hypothetical protein
VLLFDNESHYKVAIVLEIAILVLTGIKLEIIHALSVEMLEVLNSVYSFFD